MSWKCSSKKGSLDCIVKEIENNFNVKVGNYSHKKVDFMDGSLDLPEPGMSYSMAIVPGYKILAGITGNGKRLFHTTLDGSLIKENPDISNY